MDLYRVKPALLRGLDPVLAWLERSGVRPDVLTLGAIPVGAIAGIAILASPTAPLVLVLVPLAAAARLILNLLDGALARRTGMIHAKGELFNEVGDRLADVLMLAPVAFVPGAVPGHGPARRDDGGAGQLHVRRDQGRGRHAELPRDPVEARPDGPAQRDRDRRDRRRAGGLGPVRAAAAHRDVTHAPGAGHRRHPGAPVTPTQLAAATLIVIAGIGIVVAVLVGPLLRRRGTMDPRVVRARAMSYAALAGILAIAILIGLPALTVMFAAIAAVALLEWSRLADLPVHHVIALEIGSLAIMVATALHGAATADLLVGGLVLAGALMPVVRPDTNRAIRDFGLAAVGLIVLSVMLAHGVALAAERGESGVLLVAAVCLGCAGSDVGAFIVGKRFGTRPARAIALAEQDTRRARSATSSVPRSGSPSSRPPCRRSADRSCSPAWW